MGFECIKHSARNDSTDKATMKCVTEFWEDIRDWLNNTAADVVQKYIGYDARKAMQKAVIRAEIIENRVHVVSQVYYRRDSKTDYYDKVTVEVAAPTNEFDKEIIRLIEERGSLIQEMEYAN